MKRKAYVKHYTDQIEKGHITQREAATLEGLQMYDIKGQHGGRVWPSIRALSRKTGISERSLPDQLRSLEKKGYISIEHRHGNQKTNVYTIITIDIDTRAPYGSKLQEFELEAGETLGTAHTNQATEQPPTDAQRLEAMAEELKQHGYIVQVDTRPIEAHREPASKQPEEIHTQPQEEPQRATEGPQSAPQFANDKLLDIDDLQPQGAKLSEYAAAYPAQAEDIERARQLINDIINDNSNRPVYVNKQPKGLQTVKAVYMKLQLWQILAALARTNQLGNKITNYKALLTSNLYLAAFTDKQQEIDRRRAREEREEAERRRVQAEQMRIYGRPLAYPTFEEN